MCERIPVYQIKVPVKDGEKTYHFCAGHARKVAYKVELGLAGQNAQMEVMESYEGLGVKCDEDIPNVE